MLKLRRETPREWTAVALAHFDAFLQDHAANERKASQSALRLAVEHPANRVLTDTMVELAREELEHFVAVYRILCERGVPLAPDLPDPYMGALHRLPRRQPKQAYLLDRLLVFAIVEARACERLVLIADALACDPLGEFYRELGAAEARHHATYYRLARELFAHADVGARLDELLQAEANVIASLPLRPAIH